MKVKQLRELIREAIHETLKEAEISPQEKAAKDAEINSINKQIQALQAKKSDLSSGRASVVSETGLKEMARTPIKYKLSDNYQDKVSQLPYAGSEKRMKWINGIIDYISQEGSTDITSVAKNKFNVPQPRIADYARDMIRLGILEPETSGVVPQFMQSNDKEKTTDDSESSTLDMGNLSKYFSPVSNDDNGNEEDFNTEEEPTIGDIDNKPVSTSSMSDEDYNAWDKYYDLKTKLNGVKSDLNKITRSKKRGSVAGDIKDKPSTEEQRLRDLKKSLEDRINTLVQNSDYLKKKTGQETTPTPEIEDIEDDETIDESFDSYQLRKMQYYAGIKK